MPDQTQTSFSSETTRSNGNVEPKFKKLLYNEVTLAIAIIGITVGVINYINNPQKAIEAEFSKHQALQQQTEVYIESEMRLLRDGDLKDLKADLLENRNEIQSLKNLVVELKTVIQERIPAKK